MKRLARVAVIIGAVILLAGCQESSPNFLDSKSPIASKEADLFWITLALSVVVFVVVEGLLIYNVIRYRQRRGDDSPPTEIRRVTLIEFLYTAIPLALVILMFILTIRTINAVEPPERRAGDLQVQVIGYRWWWEFVYPDLGIVTSDELHIPADTAVHLTLDSPDIIHSFWVPQLGGKLDAVPGQTNDTWITGDEPGEYWGFCAEFCGLNHATMRFRVIVDSPENFQAWVARQQAPPEEPQTDLQQTGYEMITQGMCAGCHTLGAKQTTPTLGPDLAHLFSRKVFAGASYELTEENLRRWLANPDAMKPGNLMSNIRLNQQAIDAVVAYFLLSQPGAQPAPSVEATQPSGEAAPQQATEEANEDEQVQQEASQLDGEQLVQERCTNCHTLERVDEADYDRDGWEHTVDRMIAYGAQLNDAERLAVIEYLAETH